MLMAAGLGTRLRPFTDFHPKFAMPLMGIPMAQFAIDALVEAGVSRIAANVHHLPEKSRAALQELQWAEASVAVSDESNLLLGSAGGIRQALTQLDPAPFFLLNSDVVSDVDLGALARRHAALRSRWGVTMTLAIFAEGPAPGKYREIKIDLESGLIAGVGELVSGKPFFIGAAVMEPVAFDGVPLGSPSEFVPSVLLPAIAQGRAGAFLCQGLWHDIGSPELWLESHVAFLRGLETGQLHPRLRARVEAENRRVAQAVWVSKRASRVGAVTGWSGPAYWNPWGDDTAGVPAEFGPRAALYGASPGERPLQDGIGFKGIWTAC